MDPSTVPKNLRLNQQAARILVMSRGIHIPDDCDGFGRSSKHFARNVVLACIPKVPSLTLRVGQNQRQPQMEGVEVEAFLPSLPGLKTLNCSYSVCVINFNVRCRGRRLS